MAAGAPVDKPDFDRRRDRAPVEPSAADRDRFLTPPTSGRARTIALDYVRSNAAAFGLDGNDLDGVRVEEEFTWRGIRHVQLRQVRDGLPVLDANLSANVTGDGRLINVVGTPQPDPGGGSTEPAVGAAGAVESMLRSAGSSQSVTPTGGGGGPERLTTFAGGHEASLGFAAGAGGDRLAWSVLAFVDSDHVYSGLVDARTGSVISRANMVRGASGKAVDYYPGAPVGGELESLPYRTTGLDPWLTTPDRLEGDNAIVYSDENDDLATSYVGSAITPLPAASDHIRPSSGATLADAAWNYTPALFPVSEPGKQFCPASGCTWDNFHVADSWLANRAQAGAQAFYFANKFHDHLQDDPSIAFTDSRGNFELTTDTVQPGAGDPLHVQVDDGADTEDFEGDPAPDGFPTCNRTNNANMFTPRDGRPPRMQLFLFSNFCLTDPSTVNDVNSADDAAIVYHEYTHGMTSRLICCQVNGMTTLSGVQGDAMSEGWSDWYAFDLLEEEGNVTDGPNPDVRLGDYEQIQLRTQPIDCLAGVQDSLCPGPGTSDPDFADPGGYTLGAFGKIVDVNANGAPDPEEHADGEIWGETLWDLRRALIARYGREDGISRVRGLVTGSLILAAGSSPSFLDMRDHILATDFATYGNADEALIWSVFALRGMGFSASTTGEDDTAPNEEFDVDPAVVTAADTDGDGFTDDADNCPAVLNPDQADLDGDGLGDACDDDDDGDQVPDTADNCRAVGNPSQPDTDGDGIGNACDTDGDGDLRFNGADNCPTVANHAQSDLDGDGTGDACDTDKDNDTLSDGTDNCPTSFNPAQADLDGDGTGDACDSSDDRPPVVTPPTDPPVVTPARPTRAGLSRRRIRVDRLGRFTYSFSGQAALAGSATLKTVSRVRVGSTRRKLTFAQKSFRVSIEGRVRLRVRLSKAHLRALKRYPRGLRTLLTVTLVNSAGSTPASTTLTLLPPPRR